MKQTELEKEIGHLLKNAELHGHTPRWIRGKAKAILSLISSQESKQNKDLVDIDTKEVEVLVAHEIMYQGRVYVLKRLNELSQRDWVIYPPSWEQ